MPLSKEQENRFNDEALKDKAILIGVKKDKVGPWEHPHIFSKYTGKSFVRVRGTDVSLLPTT